LVIVVSGGIMLASGHLTAPFSKALHAAGFPGTVGKAENVWCAPLPEGTVNAADTVRTAAARIQADNLAALRALDFARVPGEGGEEHRRSLRAWYAEGERMRMAQLYSDEVLETPPHASGLQDYVATHRSTLQMLADMPPDAAARYVHHVLPLYGWPSRELYDVGSVLRLLRVAGYAAVYRDDGAALVEIVEIHDKVIATLEQTYYEFVFQAWFEEWMGQYKLLEYALGRVALDASQLQRLAEVFADSTPDLVTFADRMQVSESLRIMAYYEENVRNKASRTAYDRDDIGLNWGRSLPLILAGDALCMSDLLARSPELATLPSHTSEKPEMATARAVLPGLKRQSVKSVISSRIRIYWARSGLARTAIALERYRLAESRYVDRLEVLVPAYLDAIPRDPMENLGTRYREARIAYRDATGKPPNDLHVLAEWLGENGLQAPPVKYRLLDDRYLVYSAGRNEEDNGAEQERRAKVGGVVYRDDVFEVVRRGEGD
jgi:hypothetical protein